MYEVDRWLLRLLTALLESCPTRILLPSPQATEPQLRTVYEGFGLNDRQIELIARATPKRDLLLLPAGGSIVRLGLGAGDASVRGPRESRGPAGDGRPLRFTRRLAQAQGSSLALQRSQAQFAQQYPAAYGPGVNNAQMAQDAYVPWQNSLEHLADGRQCAIAIEPELYLRFGESQG